MGERVHAPMAPYAELKVCVLLHFPVWGTKALCKLSPQGRITPTKARRKNTITKALLREIYCHKGEKHFETEEGFAQKHLCF